MKTLKLNNGYEMPIVGSGTNTFGKENHDYNAEINGDITDLESAVDNGYILFDTAEMYRNEAVVGKALKDSKLTREDTFITTKLKTQVGYEGKEWARQLIQESLDKLQTDYIDLFLIHYPWDNPAEILEAWDVLTEYYEKGVFKAIGVSNFEKEDLDIILNNRDMKPAMNQIESHVGHWNDDLIAYHKANDIATTAYSPLGGVDEHARQVLSEIGEKYGKSFAQVILRYQIERDVIVIPKSHNRNHQAESLDIFDFELTQADRDKIQSL